MRAYIVRHGQTEWNKVGRWQGSQNIHLNDFGKEQAKCLRGKIHSYDIEHICSSDLTRAKDTATIIKDGLDIDISYHQGLREIVLGDWEGEEINKVRDIYGDLFEKWESDEKADIGMGVENYFDLTNRANKTFFEIYDMGFESVLIVTHGAWIRAFILDILKIPFTHKLRFDLGNVGLTIVDYDNEKFDLITLNDLSHLNDLNIKYN